MQWVIAILVGLLILGAFLAWRAWVIAKNRRLAPASAARYRKAWAAAAAIQDGHRRVLEAEKVIDGALKELGYGGTFADKLKKAGPRFSQVESLWKAHKLRNRIAHEMGMTLNGRDVDTAMRAFERALSDLS